MVNTGCTKKIYLVGGAVRDKLLNLPVKDKDYVAIGYTPEDFSHLLQVGKNFPVFYLDSHTQIALARRERKISKGYNGFICEIDNVTLVEDLIRRDLTINSMAFDEENGVIIDPFLGQEDLRNKILRHTSIAFCEDPLRVLRIARFRAKLGEEWEIHSSTKDLIFSMKEALAELEPNRVYKEVKVVLDYKKSHLFFQTLFQMGVLGEIFPLIHRFTLFKCPSLSHSKKYGYGEISAFEVSMRILEYLGRADRILKLSALYCFLPFLDKSREDFLVSNDLWDMHLPKSLQKKVSLFVKNTPKIAILWSMNPLDILEFFREYKGDKNLFSMQINFFCIQQRILAFYTKGEVKDVPLKSIMEVFCALKQYSPLEWIKAQSLKPSGKSIQKHLLEIHLKVIEAFKIEVALLNNH